MHEYMKSNCEKCNKFSHCNNNDLICIARYRTKEQECEELKEQLNIIKLRRAEVEEKMQELTNAVCKTNCKVFMLLFTLITENINYVANGKVKLTEQEQDLMIREFLNNIKIKGDV